MRLSLSIVDGPAAGRKVWLVAGQVAEIGRAATMDLAVPGDGSLSEIHFSVGCTPRGCWVRDLSRGAGLSLNGQPVAESPLADGDRVRAGQTTFSVRIEGAVAVVEIPGNARPVATTIWPKVAALDAAEVAANVRLDEAQGLLAEPATPQQFLARMRERGYLVDAIRFLAHALPKREAVWWACQCVTQSAAPPKSSADRTALETAQAWAADPSEPRRVANFPAAEATHFETPAGLCAMAASFSSGSITPPGNPPVPPAPWLTAQAISAAIISAAALAQGREVAGYQQKFLDLGCQIADGGPVWPDPPAPA